MTARSLPFATAAAPMIGCNQRQREGGDPVTAKWGGPRVQVSSLIGRETPARRLSPATLSSRSLVPPIPVMDRHPANKAPYPVHKLIEYLRPIARSEAPGARSAPPTLSSRSLVPPIPVMDRHPANKAPYPVHKLIEYLRPIA